MIRGCASMVGCAVLVVAALVAGWFARDEIEEFARSASSRVFDAQPDTVELAESIGADLARRVDEKVIALGQGAAREITLGSDELTAWIHHRLRGFFPSFISDVRASVKAEELELAGRVATAALPRDRLGTAANFLPDTAEVSAAGRLDGLELGRGVYYIETVQIGALPLPDAWRDDLLTELKGGVDADLPANAVSFELPPFVTDIGVREGAVVLRGGPRDR
ncbi:MAG: hypothetical protein GWN99_06370 [Gemmatimonadetes bacterium]|uniref:Uncharacterized protein n=1 Tax=Candidatus Kutchimonas denitrificans TaxID=3056748 RepID=A0AAE4ZAD9_9BACT|nr:hypothetical protein [Gemmatimonadota bacterium]NIR76249.1 hypothetical protein [Candidatus Kutchimonas denitrificans]NIS00689.1 hypothetical protein [Gemmatimonadota bacterium]NIT66834.1 hypothetical protein [Gemmatimonadota bacterium]NIV23433.1 hypothetical protein [Gemmatimonadota bacterium]